MNSQTATPERRARIEAAVQGHLNPSPSTSPDVFAYALADVAPDLLAEVDRLRAVLREIARTATQSGDTAFGGRLCHQIEQMARAALAE